ncbi:aspartate/glutamate racemase family protein [Paraburkholderia phenoliruptrix]|uniref:aspartate/glutamate racemase family protein n=1 Tax=Paraburkholderia phenoliruptrix TaxID=252970 RepID=UPI002869D47B|nr:aspartate/glutamate racemase family protein [Paraburkholderia phenoliruptrix]WMY09589.1 Asp/Glu racemase [Paraburkholderia phenoliruptrix]
MRVACLHTADSNIEIFDAAAKQLNLPTDALIHAGRAELLAAAELARAILPNIERRTGDALLQLARRADSVLLTCSTLGPCVTAVSAVAGVPVIRVDASLAKDATRAPARVVALCATETTVQTTATLFTDAAKQSGADVEIHLVQGAWALFKRGERSRYLVAIADAAEQAYADGASVVALAQASMAPAADLITRAPRPLTSPASGLATAMRAAAHARQCR